MPSEQHRVRLRSGVDHATGHFATVHLPVSVAALSPTLSLILSSGFRESQSGFVDLPAITPSALREVCHFLRISHGYFLSSLSLETQQQRLISDGNDCDDYSGDSGDGKDDEKEAQHLSKLPGIPSKLYLPAAEHVLETLSAAQYLELNRLVELCCKVLAQNFENLPHISKDLLPFTLRMQVLQRLDPVHLCMAEATDFLYDCNSKDRDWYAKLWKRLARKNTLSHGTVLPMPNYKLHMSFFKDMVLKNELKRVVALSQSLFASVDEWANTVSLIAPHVNTCFRLLNPNLSTQQVFKLLSSLSQCRNIDLTGSIQRRDLLEVVIKSFRARSISAIHLSHVGLSGTSVRYLFGNGLLVATSKYSHSSECAITNRMSPKKYTTKKASPLRISVSNPKYHNIKLGVLPSMVLAQKNKIHVQANSKQKVSTGICKTKQNSWKRSRHPSTKARQRMKSTIKGTYAPSKPVYNRSPKDSQSSFCNGARKLKSSNNEDEYRPPLLQLSLSNNMNLAASAAILSNLLNLKKTARSLTSINLSHNPSIGPTGAAVIAAQIQKRSALTFVNLKNTGLGSEGVQSILKSLSQSSITDIDISGNICAGRLTNISIAESLYRALTNHCCKCLTSLDLSQNALWETETEAICSALSSPNRPPLMKLSLNDMAGGLSIKALKSLAVALALPSSEMKYLCLASNNLSQDAMKGFFTKVSGNVSLIEHMDWSGNVITDDVADIMAAALEKMPKLCHLDLSHRPQPQEVQLVSQQMSCVGFIKLLNVANGDQENNLAHLNVSGHRIRNTGCLALADLIPVMQNLRFLGLSNNRITDRGVLPVALKLAQHKQQNHNRSHRLAIDLSGNPISARSIDILMKAGCAHSLEKSEEVS